MIKNPDHLWKREKTQTGCEGDKELPVHLILSISNYGYKTLTVTLIMRLLIHN